MLPDEPPQPRQIGDMVIARGDDEHLAVGQIHLHVGNPDPVEEHPRSRRMNSIVLAANASNWWANPDLASTSASATESAVCATPSASTCSPA